MKTVLLRQHQQGAERGGILIVFLNLYHVRDDDDKDEEAVIHIMVLLLWLFWSDQFGF